RRLSRPGRGYRLSGRGRAAIARRLRAGHRAGPSRPHPAPAAPHARTPAGVARLPHLPHLLHPLDLLELELDRGRAAEDGDGHLDPALLEIELLDDAVEARERAVEHLHIVADLVIDADPRLGRGGGGLVLGVEDARRLGVADRLRLARRAEEAGHLRRVLDEVIDVVV